MQATTVKIQKETKAALEEFQEEHESYDHVIRKLLQYAKTKELKKKLIEAYKSMGEEDVELVNEWESASQER